MKKSALSVLCLLLVICSCKKSDTPSPTPDPTPTPPVQPPPKPDTAYIVKTQIMYYYDTTGTKILDSTTGTWSYDAQGRVDTTTYFDPSYGKGEKYITSYSYPANQSVLYEVAYDGAVLILTDKRTSYLGPAGRIDSILEAANYINSGTLANNIDYFRYDGNNNVLSDSSFALPQHNLYHYVLYTYSSNSLASQIDYNFDGTKQQSQYFQNGNLISDTSLFQSNGTFLLTDVYTYLPNPTGRNSPFGGAYIQAAQTETGYGGFSSFTHAFSYTFDSAKRISVVTIKQPSGTLTQKYVYSYY